MNLRHISEAEMKRVSRICERIHCFIPKEAFENHLYVVLKDLLPSIHFTIDCFDLNPLLFKGTLNETVPEKTFEVFQHYMHEHPGIIQNGTISKTRIGTLLTELDPQTYHRGGLCNEVFRPVDIEDQIWMSFYDSHSLTGITYSRDQRYTRADQALLALVLPHVRISWNNWKRTRELEQRLEQMAVKGEDRARGTLASLEDLTGRQREVISYVVKGLSNKEIASCLGISPRTVSKHLEIVYELLGARGRTELTSMWARFS